MFYIYWFGVLTFIHRRKPTRFTNDRFDIALVLTGHGTTRNEKAYLLLYVLSGSYITKVFGLCGLPFIFMLSYYFRLKYSHECIVLNTKNNLACNWFTNVLVAFYIHKLKTNVTVAVTKFYSWSCSSKSNFLKLD